MSLSGVSLYHQAVWDQLKARQLSLMFPTVILKSIVTEYMTEQSQESLQSPYLKDLPPDRQLSLQSSTCSLNSQPEFSTRLKFRPTLLVGWESAHLFFVETLASELSEIFDSQIIISKEHLSL